MKALLLFNVPLELMNNNIRAAFQNLLLDLRQKSSQRSSHVLRVLFEINLNCDWCMLIKKNPKQTPTGQPIAKVHRSSFHGTIDRDKRSLTQHVAVVHLGDAHSHYMQVQGVSSCSPPLAANNGEGSDGLGHKSIGCH